MFHHFKRIEKNDKKLYTLTGRKSSDSKSNCIFTVHTPGSNLKSKNMVPRKLMKERRQNIFNFVKKGRNLLKSIKRKEINQE